MKLEMEASSLTKEEKISAKRLANSILDVAILLLESGAHCERINRNVQRIADTYSFKVDMLLTFTAISVTVTDLADADNTATINKKVRHHGAHYGILTNTSILTWNFYEKRESVDVLEKCLEELRSMPKHSIWVVRLFIGVACGCLCLLAGGNWINGLFAFSASFVGLIVRQEMVKYHFNLMIAIVCSAFVTTTISGLDTLLHWGAKPDIAVATAVLFLIPGVPLINCIIDLFEGYIPTAIARGAFGGFILLCIAVGMFLSMNLIGISNF